MNTSVIIVALAMAIGIALVLTIRWKTASIRVVHKVSGTNGAKLHVLECRPNLEDEQVENFVRTKLKLSSGKMFFIAYDQLTLATRLKIRREKTFLEVWNLAASEANLWRLILQCGVDGSVQTRHPNAPIDHTWTSKRDLSDTARDLSGAKNDDDGVSSKGEQTIGNMGPVKFNRVLAKSRKLLSVVDNDIDREDLI